MENKLITKIISVWVSIHPDHYYKHLFKSMCLTYKYDLAKNLVELSIFAESDRPCKVNLWSYKPNSPVKDKGEDEVNKTIVTMANKLLDLSGNLDNQPSPSIAQKDVVKDIIIEANLIASQNNEDENMESKLDRLILPRLDEFNVKEVASIKKKNYNIVNEAFIINDEKKLPEEYLNKLQDSVDKSVEFRRNVYNKSRHSLLTLQDLTLDPKADFTDETLPKFISTAIEDSIRKMDLSDIGLPRLPKSFITHKDEHIGLITYAKAAGEKYRTKFMVNLIMGLVGILRPKDMVVYEWRYYKDLAEIKYTMLKLGSWLISKDSITGVAVYGKEHEKYKLRLMLTSSLTQYAANYDEFLSIDLPDGEVYKICKDVHNNNGEGIEFKHLTLKTYNGTQYISKYCKQPDKARLCKAVDEMK